MDLDFPVRQDHVRQGVTDCIDLSGRIILIHTAIIFRWCEHVSDQREDNQFNFSVGDETRFITVSILNPPAVWALLQWSEFTCEN